VRGRSFRVLHQIRAGPLHDYRSGRARGGALITVIPLPSVRLRPEDNLLGGESPSIITRICDRAMTQGDHSSQALSRREKMVTFY
jgi:hypothetical protein